MCSEFINKEALRTLKPQKNKLIIIYKGFIVLLYNTTAHPGLRCREASPSKSLSFYRITCLRKRVLNSGHVVLHHHGREKIVWVWLWCISRGTDILKQEVD